ncbi:hypothetical protein NMG60_11015209 [Bertholletia excelsa]
MQSQIVCSGCRSILLYSRGATNVCCALCSAITPVPPQGAITPVPPQGMEMAQLICGGCRVWLMYTPGAASVRCSCCQTLNLVPAHINCGNCHAVLMYPNGAASVRCAICHYITNVNAGNLRAPIPVHRPNGTSLPATASSTSRITPQSESQTVVVENPMSVDESGKLVSNVVVGVTTGKK